MIVRVDETWHDQVIPKVVAGRIRKAGTQFGVAAGSDDLFIYPSNSPILHEGS